MTETWIALGLCALCVPAAWWDVRTRRIPNALVVSGLAAALGLRAAFGTGAFGAGLAGAALGLAVTLPLFALGGMGGGDVKLLAAVGAFLGPARLPLALLVTALLGGFLALFAVVRRRALGRTLSNLGGTLRAAALALAARNRAALRTALPKPGPDAVTIPYGVPIAAGALLGVLA